MFKVAVAVLLCTLCSTEALSLHRNKRQANGILNRLLGRIRNQGALPGAANAGLLNLPPPPFPRPPGLSLPPGTGLGFGTPGLAPESEEPSGPGAAGILGGLLGRFAGPGGLPGGMPFRPPFLPPGLGLSPEGCPQGPNRELVFQHLITVLRATDEEFYNDLESIGAIDLIQSRFQPPTLTAADEQLLLAMEAELETMREQLSEDIAELPPFRMLQRILTCTRLRLTPGDNVEVSAAKYIELSA